jgi:sporulation protein YlmC with PRC-barrel domain
MIMTNITRLTRCIFFGASLMSTQSMAQTASSTLPATTPVAVSFVTTQPMTESLVRVFLGAIVKNPAGETVGDINDLMFDKAGKINTVVLGVGGFLGMGEKDIGVPFSALTISKGADGARMIVVPFTKEALTAAPTFVATEKTTMDTVRDKAADLGHKTADKAIELKDQAAKKIDDMTKPAAKK